MKRKVFATVGVMAFMLLFIFVAEYFILAPITVHSQAIYWYVMIFFGGLGSFLWFMLLEKDTWDVTIFEKVTIGVVVLITTITVVLTVIFAFAGSVMVNAKKYSQLVEINNGDFAKDIPNANDTVPIMDQETASNIGARVMGDIDNVSQYEVSYEYNMITYNGKAYRVSPLEYASTIKALGNSGISGYVLVDCVTQDAKLVTLNEKIMYSPSATFSYDLKRHVRAKYPNAILGKEQFEIDEEGVPYYIYPVYKTTIGMFSGKVLDKVIIVNAINGNIDEYGKDKIPEWVDHTDSISHLAKLAEYNLMYKNGFLNSFIKQKDVKLLSYSYRDKNFKGYSSVMINNHIEYFTGVTSVNRDESILGFLYLNPKDGTITLYDCIGAEESSAMLSAEALVQNYGYVASYPYIINVDGNETYLIALKDKTGTNKAYALVNVRNFTISAEATTKEEALSKYISILNTRENGTDIPNTENENGNKKITSNITAIYNITENGTTYFYYQLDGYDELFVSSILNNREQAKLKVYDRVTVIATKTTDGYYEVSSITF